jgi:hypothetical protein
MEETKSSTKILMVTLVLLLAAGMLLAGYYYGKASVVCPHDSNRCYQQEETDVAEEETESEETADNKVASESIRDVDFEEVFEDEIDGTLDSYEYIDEISYVDLTGDGQEEAVFLAMTGGSGAGMGVFVYSYQNGELKQLLEESGYSNYQYEITNQNRLKVTAINMNSVQNKNKVHAAMERDVEKSFTYQNGRLVIN